MFPQKLPKHKSTPLGILRTFLLHALILLFILQFTIPFFMSIQFRKYLSGKVYLDLKYAALHTLSSPLAASCRPTHPCLVLGWSAATFGSICKERLSVPNPSTAGHVRVGASRSPRQLWNFLHTSTLSSSPNQIQKSSQRRTKKPKGRWSHMMKGTWAPEWWQSANSTHILTIIGLWCVNPLSFEGMVIEEFAYLVKIALVSNPRTEEASDRITLLIHS